MISNVILKNANNIQSNMDSANSEGKLDVFKNVVVEETVIMFI